MLSGEPAPRLRPKYLLKFHTKSHHIPSAIPSLLNIAVADLVEGASPSALILPRLSDRPCLPVNTSSSKYSSKLILRNPLSLARNPVLLATGPCCFGAIVSGANHASRRTLGPLRLRALLRRLANSSGVSPLFLECLRPAWQQPRIRSFSPEMLSSDRKQT